MFSDKYKLLLQEGYLSRSSLVNGMNSILKFNITDLDRGNFYVGMFQLSIGFERILKITLILDYMLENQLEMIPSKILKKQFSHSIKKLYDECLEISRKYPNVGSFITESHNSYGVLLAINDFAVGARYYNLDKLGGVSKSSNSDPLNQWWKEILDPIIDQELSTRFKNKQKRLVLDYLDNNFGNTLMPERDFNGNLMTMSEITYNVKLIERANYYVNWKVIEILNPIYDLISAIQTEIDIKYEGLSEPKLEDIPLMHEFYPFLLEDKQSAIRRKKWD